MAASRTPTRKLSIRLLREHLRPSDSLRSGVELKDWVKLPKARIAFGNLGRDFAPEWAGFLELTEQEKKSLRNRSTYALVFLHVRDRWFCITFGIGHVKLKLGCFENNFGLQVALNEVNPENLRSVDVRTPDSNTLLRRSQSSRGSDQSIFGIDIHQDILRVLAGEAKDTAFAKRLAGADALTLHRKATLQDLPTICADAYDKSQEDTYKEHFGWIDQIAHVRDQTSIDELESQLATTLTEALKGEVKNSLHLAFPEIYDPEQVHDVKYRGFRSTTNYSDLDLSGYVEALRERGIDEYSRDYLSRHRVHEVDDRGRDCGRRWTIGTCLGCEVRSDGELYVLSGGKWYAIDPNLAAEVRTAFERLPKVQMPMARREETEPAYNKRVGRAGPELLLMDRRNIRATGAATPFEFCDLLGRDGRLIHVKNGSAASRLSHLFLQGITAARVLKIDDGSRDAIRGKIREAQEEVGREGFESVIPLPDEGFDAKNFKVVYAVIRASATRQLSFFSLLSLARAEEEIRALGYPCAFAWIDREGVA
ncbi:DUF6119 family protein [Candidatus Palauibacter sp.]|uniref:DUF6119 family protein n=1 Tax=Candidatus Palauibacter sp. TaxID=3101350 RepID=UPI003D14EEE7